MFIKYLDTEQIYPVHLEARFLWRNVEAPGFSFKGLLLTLKA